jgi:hypothetical protein
MKMGEALALERNRSFKVVVPSGGNGLPMTGKSCECSTSAVLLLCRLFRSETAPSAGRLRELGARFDVEASA